MILIEKDFFADDETATDNERKEGKKFAYRHEIIHAFLNENGLARSPVNEEWAVDMLAKQIPKMMKAFEEAGAL